MTKGKTPNPSRQLFWFVSIAAVLLLALLIFSKDTLYDTWETLKNARLELVLLLPILQSINYMFIGLYYRGMFKQFGTKISISRAWGVQAAMNFVNQILPSGGLSGITYLAYGFRTKVEAGKTTLIQLGRYIFVFISYGVLLPVALFMMSREGSLDELSTLAGEAADNVGALIVVFIFISFVLFLLVLFVNRKLSNKIGQSLINAYNWVWMKILRRKSRQEFLFVRKMNKEFHDGVDHARENGVKAVLPASFMFLSAVTELMIVYTAFLAVTDTPPTFTSVFIAFLAANIVGVVSIIPGDVGVHEATMVLVMSAFGVDSAVSLSATLLYRVFNKMIFLPIGFYFYTKILKPVEQEASGATAG